MTLREFLFVNPDAEVTMNGIELVTKDLTADELDLVGDETEDSWEYRNYNPDDERPAHATHIEAYA